ncbi:MAG: hypothetical protein U0L05_05775 [Schaedlerella sp.]|nr:hypothetical protein [Schaedlerella sp.]
MKERILRELPEKRERCVKHYQMTDKRMVAAVYPSPVHYEDNGMWKEIDNQLEEVEKEGKKFFQNRDSAVKVRFAEAAGEKELVMVEKNGRKLFYRNKEKKNSSVRRQNWRTGVVKVFTKRSFRA